jgi:hypothetical protein
MHRGSQNDQWSTIRRRTIPNGYLISRRPEKVSHSSHHQSLLTHSDESNYTDPHNQSPILFNCCVILTRDVSSRKISDCDRQLTSNLTLLSSLLKVSTLWGNRWALSWVVNGE